MLYRVPTEISARWAISSTEEPAKDVSANTSSAASRIRLSRNCCSRSLRLSFRASS